jgi:hypothetical protein
MAHTSDLRSHSKTPTAFRIALLLLVSLDGASAIYAQNTFPSSGNVGIGTTSPQVLLHLSASTSTYAFMETTGLAANNLLYFVSPTANTAYQGFQFVDGGYPGVGGTTRWSLMTQPGAQGKLTFFSGNALGPAVLTLVPSGYVGIGTTAPLQALDVNGNLRINQQIYSAGSYTGFLTDSGAALPIKAASLALTNSYSDSAPANGLYVLGNVAIGVPSAAQKLDVNGNIRINQHVYSPASYTGFLTDTGAALPIKAASLALTSSYVNSAPSNGLYVEGSVGIGTTAPFSQLEVLAPNSASYPLTLTEYSSNAVGALILGRKARNTSASPTAVQKDDALAGLAARGYTGTQFTAEAAHVDLRAAENFTATNQGTYVSFETTPIGSSAATSRLERMRISDDGKVGIGTSIPTATLEVNGTIKATTVIGAVYQDVAEWVPSEEDLPPGTVVVLRADRTNEVVASREPYDIKVAGVVSAAPGILLGREGNQKAKIATTGRVRVKVDASKQPIRVGDLLVTSDILGTAMRSQPTTLNGRAFHQPGTIIGKALEPLAKGQGEILILLSLQ